jgi:Zn-dependent protease with chaperone function
MTRRKFEELARRIEARYAGRPAALERATLAWVALGLAGVVAWVGVLLVAGILLFVLGIALGMEGGFIILGFGVLVIVYALSQAGLLFAADVHRKDGRALRRGEAQALAAMLDSLRRELGCRSFDEVRFTMDFNAGVYETPRLGLLGWPRTALEIGVPLLAAVAPEEFRAVLAHEFAHMSARHGRRGHRLYRLRRTWEVVFERLRRPVSGSFGRGARYAVAGFADWYWPRLNCRALALSRFHEFQADQVAAAVAGQPVTGLALWRIECLGFWIAERFWVELRRDSESTAEPPDDVLARLRTAFQTPPPSEDAGRWVERALRSATVPDETHPAFSERARALGMSADGLRETGFPTGAQPSAAEVLLGADLPPIERDLAAQWKRSEAAAWRERHRRTRRDERTPAPAPQPSHATDEAVALWESARETAELRGLADAVPMLRGVLERDPRHSGAAVALGRYLLSVGDPEGEHWLLGVVERSDEHWLHPACEALRDHYRGTGQPERYREFTDRIDRHEAELKRAQRERATVGPRDRLLPHGLDDSALDRLRATLASQPGCALAWLARKELKHFPERPLFLLCAASGERTWFSSNDARDRDLVRQLVPAVELPGQVLVVAMSGSFRAIAKRVAALPGSHVYARGPLVPS